MTDRVSAMLLCLLVLAGCDDGCSGTIPPPVSIESGSFAQVEEFTDGTQPFPHAAATDLRLTVDRGAGTVTVTYDLAGSSVVETWSIVGSTFER